MMDKNSIDYTQLSDKAIIASIGSFIKESRLGQNKTQQELAEMAGINRSTLVQIESGGGGGLLTFVQILRALDQLHVFQDFERTEQISPLLLAKIQRKKRQRASSSNKTEVK